MPKDSANPTVLENLLRPFVFMEFFVNYEELLFEDLKVQIIFTNLRKEKKLGRYFSASSSELLDKLIHLLRSPWE